MYFWVYKRYHDVSIWFPLVSSTVQGGKGHARAGVVCTGDERNCLWKKVFYNYMQQLQPKNKHAQCGENGKRSASKTGTHISTISSILHWDWPVRLTNMVGTNIKATVMYYFNHLNISKPLCAVGKCLTLAPSSGSIEDKSIVDSNFLYNISNHLSN